MTNLLKASGGMTSGAGLRGASTHFIQTLKNKFFSRNLGQNMPKNAYFLEKRL